MMEPEMVLRVVSRARLMGIIDDTWTVDQARYWAEHTTRGQFIAVGCAIDDAFEPFRKFCIRLNDIITRKDGGHD